MPWDQMWLNLQPYVPSLETGALFLLVIAVYFFVQHITGIRNIPSVIARDLAIVAVLWGSATALVLMEPNHHWLQRGANWLVNLL